MECVSNKINRFIDFIESIDSDLKVLDFNFKFIISTKINLTNSKLYFLSYQNENIFVMYFTYFESVNLIKINFIDYNELTWDLNLKSNDIINKDQIELAREFVNHIVILSKNIIKVKKVLDKNFLVNSIYPSINKIYLKSYIYNKYCVILICDNYFMVTFNDEKENYFRVNSLEELLVHNELSIFRKKTSSLFDVFIK